MNSLTDDEVLRTFNDLEMMRRPHLWPGRVLHLKQRDGLHAYRNFALLEHKEGHWTFTPKMKADAFSEPNFAKSETGDEKFLKGLVDKGWMVD